MVIHPGDGDLRHGTVNGYVNLACRCSLCRQAHTDDCRWRKRQRTLDGPDDPRHGTENGYGNYNCRCRACTDAWSAASVARTRRARERRRAA